MTQRKIIVLSGAALVVFVVVVLAYSRRAALARVAPSWLNVDQPEADVAARVNTLNAAQSWAANRCRPMSACCTGQTAGTRVRRTYPSTLAEHDGSIVRAGVDLRIGG